MSMSSLETTAYVNEVDKNLIGLLAIAVLCIWIKVISMYIDYGEDFDFHYNNLNERSDITITGNKRRIHTSPTREIRARHSIK